MTASTRSARSHHPTAIAGSPGSPGSTGSPRAIRPARGRRLALPLLAILVIAAGGCRAQERSFPGESPANVWSAARAAAESPDYMPAEVEDRWNVDVNEVLVDEEAGELEIYRRLSRLHLRSGGDRFVERRTWTLGVDVTADPEAPTVRLVSRGLAVPAHVTAEAERYFDQIAELLLPPALGDTPDPVAAPDADAGPATP